MLWRPFIRRKRVKALHSLQTSFCCGETPIDWCKYTAYLSVQNETLYEGDKVYLSCPIHSKHGYALDQAC